MEGLVLGGSNNIFSIECDDGIIRQCGIKGKKLQTEKAYYNPLAPGDRVIIEPDEKTEEEQKEIENKKKEKKAQKGKSKAEKKAKKEMAKL